MVLPLATVMDVEVHHLTENPTLAWKDISKTQRVIKVNAKPPVTQVTDDKVYKYIVYFITPVTLSKTNDFHLPSII